MNISHVKIAPPEELAKIIEPEKTAPLLTPLDTLGTFGPRISAMVEMLKQLGCDIDAAAILFADQLKESEGKNEKLKQLQALLKSLG